MRRRDFLQQLGAGSVLAFLPGFTRDGHAFAPDMPAWVRDAMAWFAEGDAAGAAEAGAPHGQIGG